MRTKSVDMILLWLPLILSPVYAQQARTIRVPMDQPTIQAGINSAHTGDTVLVSDGTYFEFINFNGKDIVVASEFLTTGMGSHIENTIIDARSDGGPVVIINGESQAAHFIGFTVRNGMALMGGGIVIENSSPHLSHLIITRNIAYSRGPAFMGQKNINYVPEASGGGVLLTNSKAILSNILFYGNAARVGSALYISGNSNAYAEHITISGNSSGSQVVVEDNSKFSLLNSIIWRNEGTSLSVNDTTASISYSDIDGGWKGVGNIDVSPRFKNNTTGDYRLCDFSPCIGAGGREITSPNDLAGQERPQPAGSFPDMGAYENIRTTPFVGPGITLSADVIDFGEVFLRDSVRQTFVVRNPGTMDLLIFAAKSDNPNFRISPSFAGIDPEDSDSFTVTFVPSSEMIYAAKLLLLSNAVNNDSVIVTLKGRGVKPPVVHILPESLNVSVNPGQKITKKVTITNNGESNLCYNIIGVGSNRSLQYDGSDDYVMISNFDLVYEKVSVEAWVYLKSISGIREIIDNVNEDIQLEIWTDRSIMFDAVRPASRMTSKSNAIPLNQWVHIAGVYNGTMSRIYVNGLIVAEKSVSGSINMPNTTINIGTETNAREQFWDGKIDEVRIWNLARTQSEIQLNMGKELIGTEPGLAGYWRFNEGNGVIAFDQTMNRNDGSLQGGVERVLTGAPILPGWLSTSIDTGVCAPQTSVEVTVTFDATNLDTGNYFSTLMIRSNDPLREDVVIPVRVSVTSITGVDDTLTIPVAFNLAQNFPNPFNPGTKIIFALPIESSVRLTVYDIIGREVAVLVNEMKLAGYYSVSWDASAMPSGIYFYRLRAGQFTETKRMILMK